MLTKYGILMSEKARIHPDSGLFLMQFSVLQNSQKDLKIGS